jgi:hypothetical protein
MRRNGFPKTKCRANNINALDRWKQNATMLTTLTAYCSDSFYKPPLLYRYLRPSQKKTHTYRLWLLCMTFDSSQHDLGRAWKRANGHDIFRGFKDNLFEETGLNRARFIVSELRILGSNLTSIPPLSDAEKVKNLFLVCILLAFRSISPHSNLSTAVANCWLDIPTWISSSRYILAEGRSWI